MNNWLVEAVTVGILAMFSKTLAMGRQDDDQGLIEYAELTHMRKQLSQMLVSVVNFGIIKSFEHFEVLRCGLNIPVHIQVRVGADPPYPTPVYSWGSG